MITIRNLSNQPHLVDDKSLGVDGEVKVKAVTDDIRRLVDKGFVAIVEPETEPVTPPVITGQTGGKKN